MSFHRLESGSVEVFFKPADSGTNDDGMPEQGWYWWACFPGCLPDSEPHGPFKTELEAFADAEGDQ